MEYGFRAFWPSPSIPLPEGEGRKTRYCSLRPLGEGPGMRAFISALDSAESDTAHESLLSQQVDDENRNNADDRTRHDQIPLRQVLAVQAGQPDGQRHHRVP